MFIAPVKEKPYSSFVFADTLNVDPNETKTLLNVSGVGYVDVFQIKLPSGTIKANEILRITIDGNVFSITFNTILNVSTPIISEVRGHKGWNLVCKDTTGNTLCFSYNGIISFSSSIKIEFNNQNPNAETISYFVSVMIERRV
jgi:hypothetical protein